MTPIVELMLWIALAVFAVALVWSLGRWVVTSGSKWVPVLGRLALMSFGFVLAATGVSLLSDAWGKIGGASSAFVATLFLLAAWRVLRRLN